MPESPSAASSRSAASAISAASVAPAREQRSSARGERSVLILAAGLGSRLAPLTQERPKPLVEVLGTPLVHYALRHAAAAGATRIALNSHHLHPALPEALGDNFQGIPLTFAHEPTLLGTGGGIRNLADRLLGISAPFAVLNADALLDLDLSALWRAHDEAGADATLALRDAPDKARYGLIGTDAHGRVVDFAGRAQGPGRVEQTRMFCGWHILQPPLLERLPRGTESCINRIGYPPLLAEGGHLQGFDASGYFCDVGTPERLLEANLLLLSGAVRLGSLDAFAGFACSPDAQGQPRYHPRHVPFTEALDRAVQGPALLCEGVQLEEGATVGPLSVVGRGCQLGRGARVERAVLQSGAQVAAGELVSWSIRGATCRLAVDPSHVDGRLRASPPPR